MDTTGIRSRSAGINPEAPPSGTGCVECLAASPPGWWFHLRRCAQCGHVGCCDSSPRQHARGHFGDTGHPYMQSFEPAEDWFWDFQTNGYTVGPALAPPHGLLGPRQRPEAGTSSTWGGSRSA